MRKIEIGDAIGKMKRQRMVIEDDELEEAWGMVCDGLPAPADLAECNCSERTRVGTPSEYIDEQLCREAFHAQLGRSINCHSSLYHVVIR
jgi:hypothetical protein